MGLVLRKRQGRVREAKGLGSKSEEGREAQGTTEPTLLQPYSRTWCLGDLAKDLLLDSKAQLQSTQEAAGSPGRTCRWGPRKGTVEAAQAFW